MSMGPINFESSAYRLSSVVGKVQLWSCMQLFGHLSAALAQISMEGAIIFSLKKKLGKKKLHLILIN
jgi:hypothetical protein